MWSVSVQGEGVKIEKGKKATLKATLENCEDGDSVSFQIKDGLAFEDLGSPVALNDDCKAKKRVKITKTSTFQAVALDSGEAIIATSPKVKVKLK